MGFSDFGLLVPHIAVIFAFPRDRQVGLGAGVVERFELRILLNHCSLLLVEHLEGGLLLEGNGGSLVALVAVEVTHRRICLVLGIIQYLDRVVHINHYVAPVLPLVPLTVMGRIILH